MVYNVQHLVANNQEKRQNHWYDRHIQHSSQTLVPHLGGR